MAGQGMDPSLIQDFLAESSELIEQLDGDLVALESAPDGKTGQDLLNGIFRALHTIKGAASFLGLTTLTTFAHAAEDALNRLRKGEVHVTPAIMDALLRSVDVLRGMIQQLGESEDIAPGPDDLIAYLHEIAESKSPAPGTAPGIAPGSAPASGSAPGSAGGYNSASAPPAEPGDPLKLPAQKLDLLEFMIADLKESTQQLDQCLNMIGNDATRADAAHQLGELADSMTKTADFFELPDLVRLTRLLIQIAPALSEADGATLAELTIRVRLIQHLLLQQADALSKQRRLSWPLDSLAQHVDLLTTGKSLPQDIVGRHQNDLAKALALEGLATPASVPAITCINEPRTSVSGDSSSSSFSGRSQIPASDSPAGNTLALSEGEGRVRVDAASSNETSPIATPDSPAPGNAPGSAPNAATETAKKGLADQTVRVEVSRLEDLLNLVGQMVLTKNRVLALARRMRDHQVPHDFAENVLNASNDLDRLTGELQVGVMRTRMQPLAKLFDRYPRVIRDIARSTDKKIDLEIVGKDTEVDKSVLELLADPLVHILRNSADHGVEKPETRQQNGKPELGHIRLEAEHQGSHVRVAITDDGKGLDREVIGRKAVERGLTTPEQLAQLSDDKVFRFIFLPGFSTAEKVSDLSGRGVGLDVVNINVAKMNGTINVSSVRGKGTTFEILIPLTVAILPAMMVGVGKHLYAIPLQSVVEIVRPDASNSYTVRGRPVMRLRNTVLPLVDMRARLRETGQEEQTRFAVVVGIGGQRAGLMVDRLIGQQEIVIKPLDDKYTQGGPFSGATIREDGDVSLILDIVQLIRQTQAHPASAPAAA
ncbi:MAG: chemotaxis protein CheA [Phycisphaeraceae bacterium]|nr:chemotaxis protein CheA [Phycisphaeraceae bacterium]